MHETCFEKRDQELKHYTRNILINRSFNSIIKHMFRVERFESEIFNYKFELSIDYIFWFLKVRDKTRINYEKNFSTSHRINYEKNQFFWTDSSSNV